MTAAGTVLGRLLARMLARMLAVLAISVSDHPAWAQEPPPRADTVVPVERPVEDEVILAVRLDRHLLSDGVIGYLHRGGVLLPLGEMARLMELAIATDPLAGQAEGWMLTENRRFFLDTARRTVVIAGQRQGYPAALVEPHRDDIYVDAALLSRWLPVDLTYDLAALTLVVASREPLPVEQRLERQARWRFLVTGPVARRQYDRVATPHRAWDWPLVDNTLGYRFTRTGGHGQQTVHYSTLATGDLAFLDTNLFIAGEREDPVSAARLTMGRTDPDGGLLGGLTELSAGDVFTPQLPLIARGRVGRGLRLSSFPVVRSSEFDRTTLRGDLPPGWEVELYRNDVLFDFQLSRADGRYEFVDVPLLFGNNVLRLAFYGPQGQRRDEVQRFHVGQGLVRPGRQHVALSLNQEEQDLLPVGRAPRTVDDPDRGRLRAIADYQIGVTNRLSLAGSAASYSLDGQRRGYLALGARATALGTFARFDASSDLSGGWAMLGSVQGRLLGVNYLAEHTELRAFTSDLFNELADPPRRRSSLRVDGALAGLGGLPRIGLTLGGSGEQRASGRWAYEATNRLSTFVGGVQASHTLTLDHDRVGDLGTRTEVDGQLLVNWRWRRLLLRGLVSYSVRPDAAVDTVSGTWDHDIGRHTSTRVTVDRQLTGDTRTRLSAGLNTVFADMALGLNGHVDDRGDIAVGLSLSFALGREPRRERLVVAPRRIATGGAVSARAFLDINQNRVFDADDRPIPGARFTGAGRDVTTDADGIALITDIASHAPTAVAIDLASIEEPYWVPLIKGHEIVPRPGKTITLDYPMTATGEIDGTVFLRRDGTPTAVSNVRMELIDAQGMVVGRARSAFDGFYLFDLVVPGRYRVRVSPDQLDRLGLAAPPDRPVTIGGDGDIVNGLDFVLE